VLPLGAVAGFGAAAVSGCATGDVLAGVAKLGGAGGAAASALVSIGCAVSAMFGQLSENFKSRSKLSDPENSERHGAATVSGGRSEHYTHISWQTQCTALRQVSSQTNEVHENRATCTQTGSLQTVPRAGAAVLFVTHRKRFIELLDIKLWRK